ncbi:MULTISPECIES: helix-turn-helix transcriptional regulator [unclassified Granulicatella]|uniref:helix-turn-helix transcriptional regulator n=1 Tax=unclassified Granulicatella TaxID=2630493 RepID=UPI0010734948|nr:MULTISPECIES: helix-turn-helix transcriptional regulator [unclassified Granulicatella]MBF0781152.1 helix-turn-helix transcriptional regulator [Granulicatella sp. 19428wC4_WM01]TFU91704.1 XRE family transcriptional regulator [Granulicatella sp. WM01]
MKMTLKMLRARDNLTQKEAAHLIGISPDTWSKWENAKSFPDVQKLKVIEEKFNIKYDDIIFLSRITV